MPTWTIKADRRRADIEAIKTRLEALDESVRGLSVRMVDDERLRQWVDAGDFRDFAPIARLHHDNVAGLEVVGEELITEFGWQIDLGRDGDDV